MNKLKMSLALIALIIPLLLCAKKRNIEFIKHMVSGFQQMTMNLSKPPAYTLHVLSECAVTPPTMLWLSLIHI